MNRNLIAIFLTVHFASLFSSQAVEKIREVAKQTAMIFEAEEALYDGLALHLSGKVLIEHEIGTLTAGQVVLNGQSDGKKVQLSHVDLYEQVLFCLSEGGNLSCAEAHLDQKTDRGEFSGSPKQPFVVYKELCRNTLGVEQLPLIVKSHKMSVEFKPLTETDVQTKSHINAIVARENVTVDYNHDFIVAADCATFHREENQEQKVAQKGLSGMICLRAEGEEGHCYVTNRNGDLIHARQIFVDTRNRRLTFAHVKGALLAEQVQAPKKRIDFSSDTVTWEEKLGSLSLRGHVAISEKGLGQIVTDDQITLFHDVAGGKKQLKKIESRGATVLTHTQPNLESSHPETFSKLNHTIHCWGLLTVDQDQLKVTMESPLGGPQVFYEDARGNFYADRAQIFYSYLEGAVKPTKILLEGDVKMLNKVEKSKDKEKQYALADFVELLPATQEMRLTAKEGSRVLVYDRVNDLQVSAQGLKIKRDAASKKESIHGVGDVRFNFLDPEFEQLHKRFEQLKKYGQKT